MRIQRKWLGKVRRKFLRSSSQSHKGVVVLHSKACSVPEEDEVTYQLLNTKISHLTKEHTSAIKIQATFRGHLARRAFRALRSLVKLQALGRGAYVRKQTRIALQCMHALVRLQVRVRAKQLLNLNRCGND